MKKVAASILGVDNKKELVNKLIDNNIKQIHYDVMDGKFVDNTSLSVEEVLDIVKDTNKHISDVHLMTVDPENQIKKLDGKVDYITFHIEACDNFDKLVNGRKSNIGFSIKPDTSVKSVEKFLDRVSHVLVMSVEPGKGGQSFMESSLEKIRLLKKLRPELIVQVDGGINNITGPKCFLSGVDSVVSGSYLINNLSKDIFKKLI